LGLMAILLRVAPIESDGRVRSVNERRMDASGVLEACAV
jgi:hypothetical protein